MKCQRCYRPMGSPACEGGHVPMNGNVTVRFLMAPPTELNRMAAASMDAELRARLHESLRACYELAAPELAASILPWLTMLHDPWAAER